MFLRLHVKYFLLDLTRGALFSLPEKIFDNVVPALRPMIPFPHAIRLKLCSFICYCLRRAFSLPCCAMTSSLLHVFFYWYCVGHVVIFWFWIKLFPNGSQVVVVVSILYFRRCFAFGFVIWVWNYLFGLIQTMFIWVGSCWVVWLWITFSILSLLLGWAFGFLFFIPLLYMLSDLRNAILAWSKKNWVLFILTNYIFASSFKIINKSVHIFFSSLLSSIAPCITY